MPAGDECLQNQIADLGVEIEELLEGVGREFVDFGIAAGVGAGHRRPATDLRQFADERAALVYDDAPRLVARFVNNFDLAREDDVEPRVALAEADQRLAVAIELALGLRALAELGELPVVELRKRGRLLIGWHRCPFQIRWSPGFSRLELRPPAGESRDSNLGRCFRRIE